MEASMNGKRAAFLQAIVALALCGCAYGDIGAGAVDNSAQRGINTDIDASLNRGATSADPGLKAPTDPTDTAPSQIDAGQE
jgi:hypothetical protein